MIQYERTLNGKNTKQTGPMKLAGTWKFIVNVVEPSIFKRISDILLGIRLSLKQEHFYIYIYIGMI